MIETPGLISDPPINDAKVMASDFLTFAIGVRTMGIIFGGSLYQSELLSETVVQSAPLGTKLWPEPEQYLPMKLETVFLDGDYIADPNGILPEPELPVGVSRSFLQYPPGLLGPGLQSKVAP